MRSYKDWAEGIIDFRDLEEMLYYRYRKLHYWDDDGWGKTEELPTEKKAKVKNEIIEIINILDELIYACQDLNLKEIKKLYKRSMKYLTPKKIKNPNIHAFPIEKMKHFKK